MVSNSGPPSKGDVVRVTNLDASVTAAVVPDVQRKRQSLCGKTGVIIKKENRVSQDSPYSGLILHIAATTNIESVETNEDLQLLQDRFQNDTTPIVYGKDALTVVTEFQGTDLEGSFL